MKKAIETRQYEDCKRTHNFIICDFYIARVLAEKK